MGLKILKPPTKNTTTINSKCPKQRLSRGMLLVGQKKHMYQSFIEFNITSLPASLRILSAILKVYLFQNYCPCNKLGIAVHQVLSPCHKGKRLIIQSPPVASASIGKENDTFLHFDITPLFVEWYTGSSANQGVLLQLSNKSLPGLLGLRSKEFCNSQYWPFLEIAYLDQPHPGESCCQTLDFNTSVITSDTMQTTALLTVQQFNYTYYIINTGESSATVSLQLSPDNTNWLTDGAPQAIEPGGILSFVPNIIASFACLTYQSVVSGQNTSLDICVRGFSS